MRQHEDPDGTMAAALEAYRDAACAEADAHFDDRALEAQRARILQRIELAGQRARVLPFPNGLAGARPVSATSRRWISAAAAAGLLIGLVTGQLLHIMPGDSWVHRQPVRMEPAPDSRAAGGPVFVTAPVADPDPDNVLLDAIDLAVSRGGATELRALHELTFSYEPY